MKSIGRLFFVILFIFLCACKNSNLYFDDVTCFEFHDFIFELDPSGSAEIVDMLCSRHPSGRSTFFSGSYERIGSKQLIIDNHNTHNDLCFYFEADGDSWVLNEAKSKGYEWFLNEKYDKMRLEPSDVNPELYK